LPEVKQKRPGFYGTATQKGSGREPPFALQGNERALGAPWADVARRWIERAANAIALAVNGAAGLLELDGVIIDGAVSRALLNALVDAVRQAMERYNWQGVLRPELHVGMIGPEAKVTGAATFRCMRSSRLRMTCFLSLTGVRTIVTCDVSGRSKQFIPAVGASHPLCLAHRDKPPVVGFSTACGPL
jgi:hypothetical protein